MENESRSGMERRQSQRNSRWSPQTGAEWRTPRKLGTNSGVLKEEPRAGSVNSISEYQVIELLGEGVTSKVFKCARWNHLFAIKFVRKTKIESVRRILAMTRSEILIHEELKRKSGLDYICKLRSCFQDRHTFYYVFDYVRGSSLFELVTCLRSVRAAPVIPLPLVKMWATQLISILRSMHTANAAHRDIKSNNIMLNRGDLCLIDFSSGRKEGGQQILPSSLQCLEDELRNHGGDIEEADHYVVGTVSHWSPALAKLRADNGTRAVAVTFADLHANDIWAAGCVIYEMITGYTPFVSWCSSPLTSGGVSPTGDDTVAQVIQRIEEYAKSKQLHWPECTAYNTSDDWFDVVDLCCRLLDPDAAKRRAFIKNDPLSHRAFRCMPAYLPPDLNPFSLESSIILACSDESRRFSDLSSLELTPNVGEPFNGRLIPSCSPSNCLAPLDDTENGESERITRTVEASQELCFQNGSHLISRELSTYGRRLGPRPSYVEEWYRQEQLMNENDAMVYTTPKQPGPQAAGSSSSACLSGSSPAATSTAALETPPVNGGAEPLDPLASPEEPNFLITLSSEANVSRMIKKIDGFLSAIKNAAEVKIWGAAKVDLEYLNRRSSVQDDQVTWCCRTKAAPRSLTGPLRATLYSYAILCDQDLYIITDANCQKLGNLSPAPPFMSYDQINRLWWFRTPVQQFSLPDRGVLSFDRRQPQCMADRAGSRSPTASIYIRGPKARVELDVGAQANQSAWTEALKSIRKAP